MTTKRILPTYGYLKKKPTGVIEISDFVNLDTNDQGEVIGIEILNASKKFKINSLFNFEIDANSLKNERYYSHYRHSHKKRALSAQK